MHIAKLQLKLKLSLTKRLTKPNHDKKVNQLKKVN